MRYELPRLWGDTQAIRARPAALLLWARLPTKGLQAAAGVPGWAYAVGGHGRLCGDYVGRLSQDLAAGGRVEGVTVGAGLDLDGAPAPVAGAAGRQCRGPS